jgi:transposase
MRYVLNEASRRAEERLRLQRIQKYGPGSEKLSDGQLELLELEPGVGSVEVQAESARGSLPLRGSAEQPRRHPGWQEFPGDLPRVERVIPCAAEQCQCKHCGQAMPVMGYEQSEQLDVEPARYWVVVTKREKRACKVCEQGGVAAAAVPVRIIDKGLVSDRVVIHDRDRIFSEEVDKGLAFCPFGRRRQRLRPSSSRACGWAKTCRV